MENHQRSLIDLLPLIKYPAITEKSMSLYGSRFYTFIVDRSLTKSEIKYALEKIFKITILEVKTCILPIKKKRIGRFVGKKSRYKKTYIKLKEGETITELLN